jgi:hypothetical protein
VKQFSLIALSGKILINDKRIVITKVSIRRERERERESKNHAR